MPARIGKQAVVVGAGMAARALADFFEHVIVLESDTLPIEATDRAGTPQCRHLHGLLPAGLQALIGQVATRIAKLVWRHPKSMRI